MLPESVVLPRSQAPEEEALLALAAAAAAAAAADPGPLMPALTLFHLARRFWNQILTCTSLKRRVCAICERSERLRYFLE